MVITRQIRLMFGKICRCKIKNVILGLTLILSLCLITGYFYGTNAALVIRRRYITTPSDSIIRKSLTKIDISPEMRRLVHLDLKGAPPKINYYEAFFPLLHKLGATGLLIEYEDMFPYSGDLQVLRVADAYSPDEIKQLLNLAKDNDLEVIPLLQTFGHFEFVLKHDKFRHLREIERYPNALCPSHGDCLVLLKEMIAQMLELHPHVQWFHIGADEVWHLGHCERCGLRKEEKNWQNDHLFLDHVIAVLKHIRETYSNIIPIMWDDMFRHIPTEILQESNIGNLVEPMVWHYIPENFRLPEDIWSKYSKVFPNIWVASAFKGATGSSAILTNPNYHLQNHLTWMNLMAEQEQHFQHFRGYAVTGWQRFDHYSVLCDLLPVAIPTLALCLQTLVHGEFSEKIHSDTSAMLGFPKPMQLEPFPRPKDLEKEATFPGKDVFVGAQLLANIQVHFKRLLEHDTLHGWLTEYQIQHNYSNPARLEHLLHNLIKLKNNYVQIQSFLVRSMITMYYPSMVEEWMAINVDQHVDKLVKLVNDAQHLIHLGARVKDYNIKTPEEF